MTKDVANIAIDCDGTVFGGYVRDFILRDFSKKTFYKNYTQQDYYDSSISPETIDRLLVPRDVDVHFDKFSCFRRFKNGLKKAGLVVSQTTPALPYTTSHRNIQMQIYKSGLSFFVQVDAIISRGVQPFGSLDFECNGLLMDKKGIRMCEELGSGASYKTILNDIKSKTARCFNMIPKRWDKMIDRYGWTVQSDHIEKLGETHDEYECLICHDHIEDEVYRFRCCSGKYHVECMIDMISRGCMDSNICIHCRQVLRLSPEEQDLMDVRW